MDGGGGGGAVVATRRSARLPASRSGGEATTTAAASQPDASVAAAAVAAAALARGFPALPEVLLKPLDPSNIHVLVVGDLGTDESTGESVVEVLRASYRVTHASGDSDALALLRGVPVPPVDLILKEHEPPATDGVKFIYRVLKNQALRHIPIVGACARAASAGRGRERARRDAAGLTRALAPGRSRVDAR
jgi:CheY-like chemotaxis protein